MLCRLFRARAESGHRSQGEAPAEPGARNRHSVRLALLKTPHNCHAHDVDRKKTKFLRRARSTGAFL